MAATPRQLLGTCPELLDVGQAPFVVTWKDSKPTVYTDGLRLKIVVHNELTLIETLRIVNEDVVEHRFEVDGFAGCWSKVRSQAFHDCLSRAEKPSPQQRWVIFSPSHASIQAQIKERYPEAFEFDDDSESDADADAGAAVKYSKKRLSWADQAERVVDEPDETHRYGGWGLEAVRIIPNRYELREINKSWSDFVLDSESIDDFFAMDEDENEILVNREMQSYSMLFDNDPIDVGSHCEQTAKIVQDDEKTVYPTEIPEEEEEEVTEEVVEKLEPAVEDADSEDTTDEDEESEAISADSSHRKRIKLEPINESNDSGLKSETSDSRSKSEREDTMANVKIVQTTPPTCKLFEEELKEYDFWLLQNELY